MELSVSSTKYICSWPGCVIVPVLATSSSSWPSPLLVAPWLASNLGHHPEDGPKLADRVRVRLLDKVKGAPGKLALKRIHITTVGDELVAGVRTHQGSGNLHSLVAGNGLTLLPAGIDGEPGDFIDALWLR